MKTFRLEYIPLITLCLMLAACGSESTPPPTGVSAVPTTDSSESAVTPAADELPDSAIPVGQWVVLDTRVDSVDPARAKQNVEDTLARYPDIAGLVGLWAYNGPAILSAVRDADKIGEIAIVCFDEQPDVLQGVLEGAIHATVVQQPFLFGYESVRVLAALVRGDRSVLTANRVIEIPTMEIKRDNVEAFSNQLKQLLSDEGSDAAQPLPEVAGTKPVRVAFVTNNASDFWNIAKAGVKKAEREYNAVCEFRMAADGSPAEQQRIVEDMLAKKVNGLAISPNDPDNLTELINRAAAVMPVITHDSDAPKSDRLCYIGTNNYKAGRQAGRLIKEALPDGGELMLFVGRMDAQNARERRQGILDELAARPMP